MIEYTRSGNKVIATFSEPWIYTITNLFAKRGIGDKETYKIIEQCLSRKTKFCGIAKCMKCDTFNLQYGKALARERLFKLYEDTIHNVAILVKHHKVKNNNIAMNALEHIYRNGYKIWPIDK